MTVSVRPSRTVGLALAASAMVFCASVVIGSGAFTVEAPAAGGVFRLEGTPVDVLAQILARNLAAVLLLFSGFVLLGSTTLMGLVFIGTWVGAGFHAVSDQTGLTNLDPLVLLYLPLEFGGLLVAAAGGLLPLVRFVTASFAARDRAPGARTPSHRAALGLLATGCVLVGLGAVLETVVIAVTGP